jgi:hypothetical protein
MDLAILILVTIMLYAFLRSYGGKGVGIKGQFAPPSTPEGKRDRVIAWGLVALAVVSAAFVFFHAQGVNRWFTIAIPLLTGALIYLISYFRNR